MVSFVATPIGNLKDITLRALETLKEADVIFCEDSRHTVKLLNAYDIKKPLVSYHKFNEREAGEKVIEKLKSGKNIAVISDAGMPVISDPGNILTEEDEFISQYVDKIYSDIKFMRWRTEDEEG